MAEDRVRAIWPAALLALASGCAAQTAAIDDRLLAEPHLASAAAQVRRCYQSPRVSHSGRQIVTTLRLRITDQGYTDGLPVIVGQHGVTAANRAFADRMAQAAIGAVVRCAPLRLPPELYRNGWREFELTFSPLATA